MTGRARIFHNIRHTGNHQNSDLNSKMTTIQLPSSMLIQNACPSNRITVAPQIACGPNFQTACASVLRDVHVQASNSMSLSRCLLDVLLCIPFPAEALTRAQETSLKALEQQRTLLSKALSHMVLFRQNWDWICPCFVLLTHDFWLVHTVSGNHQ